MAKLIISRGPGVGEECLLGDSAIIGRHMEANIRIDDLTVSRRHAQIVKGENGYTVTDLGSGNGTLVNGQRIFQTVPLKDGDEICISNVHMVFREDANAGLPVAETTGAASDGEAPSTSVRLVDHDTTTSAILGEVDLRDKEGIEGKISQETGFEELYKMHQRLKTVMEIFSSISTILEERRQLQTIMDRLFDVFEQADRGFIILQDPATKRFRPAVIKVREGQGNAQQVTISRTIAREVMEKRKGILSSDAMGDERFAGGQSIVNFQIRSMMCVPLLARDEILGLIHIDTRKQTAHFTSEDLNMLAAIANQAAISLANARLHRELMTQERLKRDLELARKIQQSFLPQSMPELEGFEFKDVYQAAGQVGGDFYDFIDLGGDELGIVVGDVSGKGVPAALLMAKLMSDVRFFALAERDPDKVVGKLNYNLATSNTEDVFVTLLYMKLDVKEKRLAITNAGHLPPLVRRGSNGEIVRIEEGVNYPLGVLPDTEFEIAEFQLNPGDFVALFTDGIIEAMNAAKEQYGFARLEAVMKQPAATPSELTSKVLADVKKFVGRTAQSDDLTLVCFGVVG